MTLDEYNHLIRIVNHDISEWEIFLEIRTELERSGYVIRQIPDEHYLRLREEKIREMGQTCSDEQPSLMELSDTPEHIRNAEEKPQREGLSREEKRHIFGTLIATGIMVALGFIIPSISLPIWGVALCVLVWELKDYIPCSGNYDSDYVQRYFKAQEDARLYTRAMIHQAHLHSGELKILNEKINGKK